MCYMEHMCFTRFHMGVARPTHAVRISLALKFQSITHDVISKALTSISFDLE